MLQHARMFGYRWEERAYLNVFLTRRLAHRFEQIVKADQLLREHLRGRTGDRVPLRFVHGLRPTRIGVIDPRIMTTYSGGKAVAPMEPVHDAASTQSSRRLIDRMLRCVCFERDAESLQVQKTKFYDSGCFFFAFSGGRNYGILSGKRPSTRFKK